MMGSNQQSLSRDGWSARLTGQHGSHPFLRAAWGAIHFRSHRNGNRVIEPWFSWGVSLELGRFRLPINGDILKVHLNVTKNWKWGGESIYVARNGVDMMGIGVSWARK